MHFYRLMLASVCFHIYAGLPSTVYAGEFFSSGISDHEKSKSICSDIQKMYDNKTLNEIQVGKYPAYGCTSDPYFKADIDNDGDDEIFKYFNTRTYSYVMEVKGDKVIALPQAFEPTPYYSGNAIIKYDGKYLQLHYAENLYELQELSHKTSIQLRISDQYITKKLYVNIEINGN